MSSLFLAFKNLIPAFIEPFIALIVGLLTVIATKNPNKYDVARNRLINAYHPIFLIAEPFLFKSIQKSSAEAFIEKYNEIDLKYSLYIYPSLRHRVFLLSQALKCDYQQSILDEHWMFICKYIEKDYDKLCKVSSMPIRSISYKLNNDQFSSKPALYFGIFKLFILPSLSFSMIWLFLVLLFKLISS